ncbi:MAG: hypothetical protein ABIZ34_07250 [Candidatus Limnocylindrales bacterium]
MSLRRRPGVGAAIDIGSNSVHLLVAAVGTDLLEPLIDESALLGLGAIVDRDGSLPTEAVEATVTAVAGYVARAQSLGAARVTVVGTEPLRRAANRSVVQADVLRASGVPLVVIGHEAEAELTLLGVTRGAPVQDRLLVMDIGGGSTEIILAGPGADPVVGAMPTGSARLTAAFVEHDPPSWFEINSLRAEAKRLVDGLPGGHPERGVLVGGSSTNLCRVTPEDAAGEPSTITRGRLERAFAVLATLPADELVTRYSVNARRARILAAGAALAEAVLLRYDLERLEVSDASLREGAIIAGWLAGDAWQERLADLVARVEPHP